MEEVFDFSLGKQNMGARNFVRQALLDKEPNCNEGSLSIKAMVRLAGGARRATPASHLKLNSLVVYC